MVSFSKHVLSAVLLFGAFQCHAAEFISVKGNPSITLFNPHSKHLDEHASKRDSSISWKEIRKFKLRPDKVLIRYQQLINNIPVYDTFIVTDGNKPISGRLLTVDNISSHDEIRRRPLIPPQKIQSRLSDSHDLNIKGLTKPELYLYAEGKHIEQPILVYIFNYQNQKEFIIDASNHNILAEHNLTHELDNNGNIFESEKRFSAEGGNAKLHSHQFDGQERPLLPLNEDCEMSHKGVNVYDLEGGTEHPSKNMGKLISVDNCQSMDNVEINTAKNVAADAYFWSLLTVEYYDGLFGEGSFIKDLSRQSVNVRINHGDGLRAVAEGSLATTLGNGDENFAYPFGSGETVLPHELAHMLVAANSKLIYNNYSGGANESHSDSLAIAVRDYAYRKGYVLTPNNWTIGHGVMKQVAALRYVDNPERDGRSLSQLSDFRINKTGVHSSSGIGNRAFYLLATSIGMNISDAYKIKGLANQMFWRRDSDYHDIACGEVEAAQFLEFDTSLVHNAWAQVGVSASCNPEDAINPSHPNKPSLNLNVGDTITLDRFVTAEEQNINVTGLTHRTKSVTISLSGGTDRYLNFANVYAKRNRAPNFKNGDYDCRALLREGRDNFCAVENPGESIKLKVYASGFHEGVQLNVTSAGDMNDDEYCNALETWSAKVYQSGDIVFYDNAVYRAKWYANSSLRPGSANVWQKIETLHCDGTDPGDGDPGNGDPGDGGQCEGIEAFVLNKVYQRPMQAIYDGGIWEAKWWTRNVYPDQSNAWKRIDDANCD